MNIISEGTTVNVIKVEAHHHLMDGEQDSTPKLLSVKPLQGNHVGDVAPPLRTPSVSPEHKPGATSGAERRSLKVVPSSGEVGMTAGEVPQISVMEDRQEGVVAMGEEETRLALRRGGGGGGGEVGGGGG